MMEVLDQRDVVTRKEHRCFGCMDKIPPGTKTCTTVSVDAGTIGRAYWCKVCKGVINELSPYYDDDGIEEGSVRNNDPDVWARIKDSPSREGGA